MAYCENCNRIVVMGKLSDGRKVPLDPKAHVFRVIGRDEEPEIDRLQTAMVAHYYTCPNATPYVPKDVNRKDIDG